MGGIVDGGDGDACQDRIPLKVQSAIARSSGDDSPFIEDLLPSDGIKVIHHTISWGLVISWR